MPIEVDPSQVHSITVDPSQVQAMPAPGAVPPAPEGAASRFFSNWAEKLNPYPALKQYLSTAPQADAADAKAKLDSGDYFGAVGSLLKSAAKNATPGARALPDMVTAQAHQFVQAYKDLKDKQQMPNVGDRVLSAAGHTAAGLLPVLGPAAAAAGEQIGSGDVAGGLGSAAGLLTSVVAPEALKAVPKVAGAAVDAVADTRNAAAGALDTSAEKNIATALNPTTKVNKALVQNKIAPVLAGTRPLLEGGEAQATTATSLKDLQAQAQANMETHGQAIDDIFDQHAAAGTKLSPKPIIAALDAEKQNYIVAGVPINEPYVAKLAAFQDQIQKVSDANGGAIPLDDLRRIRQVHDEIVSQSKGGFALPPDAQSAVNASKTFGNAIRGSFADSVPELADANKQFSFWSDVDKVTGDSLLRKTGQRAPLTQKLLEATGTLVGAHAGGPLGALAGQRAGGMLGQFQNSTLWNTLAAGVKSKLADLVETDPGAALALAKQNGIVPAAAAGTSPASQSVPTSGGLNAQPTTAIQSQAVPAAAGGSAPPSATAGGGGGSADTAVSVPGQAGGGYQARYKLRELGDINASHNGLTFAKNAEYKLTNDRDYANAVNQGKVVNWASRSEFDPKFHVTDNPDATNGPVVTDSQGNVIGGNGRAMIMQRVYGGNPKGAAAYRDLLKAKAGQFGLDPAAVDAMKHPILTREIPDSEFVGPGAKQAAVTDFNKPGTAALTPAERAVSDSRRVSAGTLDDVAGRLDAKGEGATVADALEGKAGGEVLQKLVSDGVIAPQESAAFVDADSGELTPAGKARIGQLMIGRFFKDPAQMDAIAPSIRGRLERMAAPLAQVEGKPGWNLTPDVQAAVDLLHRSRLAKMPNLDDFIRQDGLFGKQKYSDQAVRMAKAIQNLPSKQLTLGARQYAADAAYAAKGTNTLLGDAPTPAESFAEAFEKVPKAK